MSAIINKEILHAIRTEFRKQYPIKSSWLAEAMATAYGYKTSISMLDAIERTPKNILDINYFAFYNRLSDFILDLDKQKPISILINIIDKYKKDIRVENQSEVYICFKKHLDAIGYKDMSLICEGNQYTYTPEYTDEKNRRCMNLWCDNIKPLKYIIDTGKVEDSALFIEPLFLSELFERVNKYKEVGDRTYFTCFTQESIMNTINGVKDKPYGFLDKKDIWEQELTISRIILASQNIRNSLHNESFNDAIAPYVSPYINYFINTRNYKYELIPSSPHLTFFPYIHKVDLDKKYKVVENSNYVDSSDIYYMDISILLYLFRSILAQDKDIPVSKLLKTEIFFNDDHKIKMNDPNNGGLFQVTPAYSSKYNKFLYPMSQRFDIYRKMATEMNISVFNVILRLMSIEYDNIAILNSNVLHDLTCLIEKKI